MKTRYIMLAVIVLFAFGSAGAQTMNITYKKQEFSTRGIGWKVSASYPQVDFGPDALMGLRGIAGDINTAIEGLCNRKISDFESAARDRNPMIPDSMESELEITSEAFVNGGTLLSAVIEEFSYVAGSAHPLTTITTFNYSTTAYGVLDSISKLFVRESGYMTFISNYCNKDLKLRAEKDGYDNISEMIDEGTAPDVKNYGAWYVQEDTLHIVFNPYQAGPYVMGIQYVSMPLSELLPYIDPKGPLEYMFR